MTETDAEYEGMPVWISDEPFNDTPPLPDPPDPLEIDPDEYEQPY